MNGERQKQSQSSKIRAALTILKIIDQLPTFALHLKYFKD
jgi:hypothetical protein